MKQCRKKGPSVPHPAPLGNVDRVDDDAEGRLDVAGILHADVLNHLHEEGTVQVLAVQDQAFENSFSSSILL